MRQHSLLGIDSGTMAIKIIVIDFCLHSFVFF